MEDVGIINLPEQKELMKENALENEIKVIIDATHQAYVEAARNPF